MRKKAVIEIYLFVIIPLMCLYLLGCGNSTLPQKEEICVITQYSGSQVMNTWETKGRVSRYEGYVVFTDRKTGNRVVVYGEISIEVKHDGSN